jgi:hypothetical protein
MNTIVRRSPAMMRRTLPQGAFRPNAPSRSLVIERYVTMTLAVIWGWIEQW